MALSPRTTEPGDPREFVPPALVILGSVERITLSSSKGSYTDHKGRGQKK